MGRLVSNTSMTVDGLCDVGAWFVAAGGHDQAGVEQLAAAAAFVTGRRCYEGFLGFWPSATGPWAEVLNPMPKYVASRTLSGQLDWNARVIEGDAVEGVRRLKEELEGDLILSGCGELACNLLRGGVIDEVCLWVHPAVGGAGTRPFDGVTLRLELMEVTAYDSGVVRQRYRPVAPPL
ncbi:dihydrofolate reductase family protein [Nocardioides sp.]|uniref:dihydrofolate reductase family protein n=1 Tax=Nocardioides sp. TaxID=35761 RepID=UPI003D122537